MSTLRMGIGAAIFVVGCTPIDPAQNTFPQQPEPTQVAGPPGGQIDPGYGYQQPAPQQPIAYNGDQPGYPQGYQQGYPDGSENQPPQDYAANGPSSVDQGTQAPSLEPSADPNDPGYDMGQVNDSEIDATLDGYGQWEESEDYGRIWVPDTTAVGVDFTPYETDGSWIWSDAGWNYQCDLSWGWLPFHYGRWGWFDNHWGWQPGNRWTAGAVEWRGGGGYTGWRPLTPVIRDHRTGGNIRDHRTVSASDSQWRFAANNDFGHGHIKGHLFQNPSEGLRVTNNVQRPTIRGNYAPVSSASLMRNRLQSNFARSQAVNGGSRPQQQGFRNEGVRPQQQGFRNEVRPQQSIRSQDNNAPYRGTTPTWRRPEQPQTYGSTNRPAPAQQQQGNRGYNQPSRNYSPPARSFTNSRPPVRTYSPPTRAYGGGGFSPSRSSSPPVSHSNGGGGGGFRSTSGGASPSVSHSSGGSGGGGGHSGGGGGRHR